MAENQWEINDSAPATLAQEFEPPAAPWPGHDWLACLGWAAAGVNFATATMSGGIVVGGSATAARNRSVPGAGGAVLGGSAGLGRVRSAATPQGGLVAGGVCLTARSRHAAGAGGAVFGGAAGAVSVPYAGTPSVVSATMSGGAVFGGDAVASAIRFEEQEQAGGFGLAVQGKQSLEDEEDEILVIVQSFIALLQRDKLNA